MRQGGTEPFLDELYLDPLPPYRTVKLFIFKMLNERVQNDEVPVNPLKAVRGMEDARRDLKFPVVVCAPGFVVSDEMTGCDLAIIDFFSPCLADKVCEHCFAVGIPRILIACHWEPKYKDDPAFRYGQGTTAILTDWLIKETKKVLPPIPTIPVTGLPPRPKF